MVDSTNLWDVVIRTLMTSGTATIVASIAAIGLAMILANVDWRIKPFLRAITQALYGLPPVVVGVAVYIALSKNGVLGSLNWLFTIQGMIVAQTLLIFPLILGVSWTALERVSSEKRDVLRVMNASKRQRIVLEAYCARRGITNAVLLGFGRAIAEVGAVLMVGGNIAGKTRVLTTSVVLETSVGRLNVALQIGLVLLLVSLITAFTLQFIQFVRFFDGQTFGEDVPEEHIIDSFNATWDKLRVVKDGNVIVDVPSINLSSSKIVALMGESGSGKSTLLRVMCGLEGSTNRHSNDIAYVSQNPVLVMDSVAMEMGLPSRLHSHLPNAGIYYASKCGFEQKGAQRTDSLSGGEIQRLAFLRALGMNRRILILDEVTSELDGNSIKKVEDEILKFCKKGGIVFFATHNPQQAQRLADEILYIHNGCFIDENHEVAKQLRSGIRIG